MYRFFVSAEQLKHSPVIIEGDDYNHIHNVLRMRIGEQICICDGEGGEYICQIDSYNEDLKQVLLSVKDISGINRELPAKITLLQGYPKGDKFETIVQKAVELGVYEIVPVMMKRCVVKLDDRKAVKKVERLNAIAYSAAKQSKRGVIPNVHHVMTMAEACRYVEDMEYILLPYENAEGMECARKLISEAKWKKNIAVFIGPEGGFEPEEVLMIQKVGGNVMSLGHRILRTETAGLVTLSLLMFELEMLGGG